MIRMVYPDINLKWKEANGQRLVFDPIRKKWLVLTPEEWVRQHVLQYLLVVKGYPQAYIAVEKTMQLGELKKRFDLLVYDQEHKPWLMVECKAMDIQLSEAVLHQILRYNLAIPVTYLVITNGAEAMIYHRAEGRLSVLAEFPAY
ncbi:type I restriction enzyme HsdR N-terminal domain-containing protein [Flavihumibacter sp. RY-1]|uniref:Type I restriction enzyme HsdR N-terminal domain-containing protein n=1 Tax=Flavihumibacter fluminis TaxID=2909236 RepID=A0ABS9BHH4_9BACT|nr:type I restriction enzyme HsdR N-terminal domain-containing protein [Flavihumibacter fluminis]MCF1714503.1 type I restriction enzyme HsdR N-terminal domain-containing protein [Flavihumibacter fluminis]